MRIWNLNEPATLTEVVVDEFKPAFKPANHIRPRASCPIKFQSVKVLASVATFALTLSYGKTVVNHGSVRMPNWSVAIARSAPDIKPPLDELFAGRFDSEWTQIAERALINEIVENRLTKNVPTGTNTIASFIHSNQQENVRLESPRLSLGAVQELVRKRKLS